MLLHRVRGHRQVEEVLGGVRAGRQGSLREFPTGIAERRPPVFFIGVFGKLIKSPQLRRAAWSGHRKVLGCCKEEKDGVNMGRIRQTSLRDVLWHGHDFRSGQTGQAEARLLSKDE